MLLTSTTTHAPFENRKAQPKYLTCVINTSPNVKLMMLLLQNIPLHVANKNMKSHLLSHRSARALRSVLETYPRGFVIRTNGNGDN